MIISASRRTDIPAFYSNWFINRIRDGYCTVPNPFNRKQISYVSLLPKDVDCIVFWTRNPRPLFPYIHELDQLGFHYYFQFTLLAYPREIDPKSPSMNLAIQTFQELSTLIGPERVIWRYDPILLSNQTDKDFHIKTYWEISKRLNGYTKRSVISILDQYSMASRRLDKLTQSGFRLLSSSQIENLLPELLSSIVDNAKKTGMEILSCAEDIDLTPFGVNPGKCIDDHYIKSVFGIDVTSKKDPSQRKNCGCVISKDIGIYNTCLYGCQYCYATQSFDMAYRQYKEHNPLSPSMIGWYESLPTNYKNVKVNKKNENQPGLFDEDK